MFTPTQLEQVAPSMVAAAAKDLKRASDGEGKAHGHYRSRVLSPISGGAIWHDDPAKSDAVPVLAAAALAFDTVSTLMLAGTTALATLAVELDAAKRSAEKVISFARNMTFTVDMQRGEISYDPPPGSYPGPAAGGDGQHAQLNGMAMQCDALLKAALRRADRADSACGSLLAGLGYVNVPLASSNYPGLAEAARHANITAYTALGKAIQLLSQLRTAAKNDLDKVDAKDYTPLQHLYSFFKGMVDPDPNAWSEGRPAEWIGFAAGLLLPLGAGVEAGGAGTRGALALGKEAKAAEEAGQATKGAEEAGKAAEARPGLTASQARAVQSLSRRLAEHEEKLAEYRANPDAFDNKGYLKNAPTPQIRERIINGRIRHLETEIRTFRQQINEILTGGDS